MAYSDREFNAEQDSPQHICEIIANKCTFFQKTLKINRKRAISLFPRPLNHVKVLQIEKLKALFLIKLNSASKDT